MRFQASTWLRVAGGWLLLAGAAHGWMHYVSYEKVGDFSIGRRALYEAMRNFDIGLKMDGLSDPFNASMWSALKVFSVSMSMLLIFAGLTTFMIAGIRDERFKRSFAFFSAVFWIAAMAVWMGVAPMIQQMVVGTVASLLYANAWIKLR